MQQTQRDGIARPVRSAWRGRLGSARRSRPGQALAVAVAALVVLALGSAVGAAPAAGPAIVSAGTWHFDGMPRRDQRDVVLDVRATIPAARTVLDLIDGSVAIDARTLGCGPGIDACSYPEPAGAPTPWRMHLDADTTAGTYPSQRFYVLHEIGHAVWGLVLTDADRRAFVDAVRQSLHGQACRRVRDGRPCASIVELFADEFARWAGGFKHNMTGYQTPALLGATTMTRLVDGALAHRPRAERGDSSASPWRLTSLA